MTEDREKFVSHSEMIRNALWSSQFVRHGVDVIPAHGASVLVGAGMSRNAVIDKSRGFQLPDWSAISHNLVKPLAPESEELQEELLRSTGAVSGFLRLAQMYEARFGRAQLDRFIENSIQDDLLLPGRTHELLVHIPWRDIFTTNWDTLLETTARSDRLRRYSVVTKVEDLPKTPGRRIVKLHGTVHQSKRYIFTEEDFRTYPTDFAPFVNTVQQAMMETVFVLVGFSGEDPNFLKWTGWVRDRLGDYAPTLYLVGDHREGLPAREMLQRNKVVPLDLSLITDEELKQAGVRDISAASRWNYWFKYLLDGEQPPLTIWPPFNGSTGKRVGPRFGPEGMKLQSENAGQGGGGKTVKLFGPGLCDTPVDADLLEQLRAEMKQVRDTHRKWIVTPPDARDEVQQQIANWIALKSSGSSNMADGITFTDFINACANALTSEDFTTSILLLLDLAEDSTKGDKKDLKAWAENSMAWDVVQFFVDVAWLSCLILDDIPKPINDALIHLVQHAKRGKQGPNTRVDDLLSIDGRDDEQPVRERLIQCLLHHNRYLGAPFAVYKTLLSYADALGKRRPEATRFKFETSLHRVFWYAGMGDRHSAMKEVRKRVDPSASALRPYDLARIASVYSEFGVNKADLEIARKLRHEAFLKTRNLGQAANEDFELLSEESWLLAFEAEGSHDFIEQLNQEEAAISDMWRKGGQARLDELTACRCDPRRDLRRIERGYLDARYRRQGLQVLDQVGIPLDEQLLNRHDPTVITSNLLLDFFAWNAPLAILRDAKAKLLTPSRSLRLPICEELDRDVVEALQLVFRVLGHPERGQVFGDKAADSLNLDHEFLPNLVEIGKRLVDGKKDGDTVDLRSVHLCCDALLRALKNLSEPRQNSARNTIRLSLIALDCLCPTEGNGARQNDMGKGPKWSQGLAEKAVEALVEVAFTEGAIPQGETPASMRGSWNNRVERLLHLALSKALDNDALVPWVFDLLWRKTRKAADAGGRRQIEPFHLIGSPFDRVDDTGGTASPPPPAERKDENGNLEAALQLLRKLEDRDADCEERKSDLIRFIDVMSDWKFNFPSDRSREEFAETVKSVFERCKSGHVLGLRRWEWMMIDAVRKPATAAFERWAYKAAGKFDVGAPEWQQDARTLSKNLHGAICQPRTEYHPKVDHVRVILNWMNCVIDAYRNANLLAEMQETTRFTAIFMALVDNTAIMAKLKPRDFELMLSTLSNMLSIGAPVERAVPECARRFSPEIGDSAQLQRLSSLLRRGLAMIHHSESQDQFDRTIEATLTWVVEASEGTIVVPPQPALLGALGQALAVPRSDRGQRVLRAIGHMLAARGNQDVAMVADVLADLRQRVDGMLTGVSGNTDSSDVAADRDKTVLAIRDTFRTLKDLAVEAGMTEDTDRLEQGIRALEVDIDTQPD